MTYKELLHQVSFDEVVPYIEKYHGEKGCLALYKIHYDMLRHLTPNPEDSYYKNATVSHGEPDEDWPEPHLQDKLAELKLKFIKGGMNNGYKKSTLERIWKDWEHKGMYAFNKAHAVCYSWLGYQMGYLKANYPEVFNQVMKDC